MITILKLTAAAPDVCRAINGLLQELSATPHSVDEARLGELVGCPHIHIFLATDADTRACVGMYTLASSPLLTGTKVWLEDVVVSNRWQGRGLGRRLVEDAIARARRLYPGATLMLTSRPSRKAANHIYATLFQPKETNVYSLKIK